jgi:UDP-N-acetylmuramoylalanine--D-glutamate ligase
MVVVIGLGKTGISCVRYLVSQGLPVAVVDNREQPPGLSQIQAEFPQVPITLGSFPESLLNTASELVVSPGVALSEPAIAAAIAKGIPVSGDIEWFARKAKAPIVAITGTNAKGTVTTLLGLMVEHSGQKVVLGGNIGIPVLDLLAQPAPDWYVLELSSFQLETTRSLKPFSATILNISPDHLDRYNSLQDYIAAKQRIYQGSQNVVYWREQVETQPLTLNQQQWTFGLTQPSHANEFGIIEADGQFWLAQGEQKLFNTADLRIKGRHNWLNALAALALGSTMDLTLAAMLSALREFSGLPHRCQWLGQAHGVSWFNDSKATNVGSALAALEGLGPALEGKIILIAGGVGKGADFTALQAPVAQYVRSAILLGQDAQRLAEVLAPVVPIQVTADLTNAVNLAKQLAQPGDAVLLAPACASLDMFADYNQRGDVFSALVHQVIQENAG